jgi:hypothetical protein
MLLDERRGYTCQCIGALNTPPYCVYATHLAQLYAQHVETAARTHVGGGLKHIGDPGA